jgi:diguanylate cyclase
MTQREATNSNRMQAPRFPGRGASQGFAALLAVIFAALVWLAGHFALGGWALLLMCGVVALGVFFALRYVVATALQYAGERVERAARDLGQIHDPNRESSVGGAEIAVLENSLRVLDGRVRSRLDAARRDTAYFRRLAEDTRGLEAFFGADGRMQWASPALYELTGHTLEESFATDPLELWFYLKDRSAVREYMDRARAGEICENVEIRVQRKDGSMFWCSCQWHPYYDAFGELTGLRFSGQDIEPRKRAELKLLETVAALHRAQALKEYYLNRSNDERMRLSALLDIVNLGILFIGRDRRVVYINQPAADMWQLGERSSMVGARDIALMEMTGGLRADDAAYRAHVLEVVALRRNSEPYDVRMKDGRVLRELSTRVQSADGNRVIGRVWIFEDVTEALQAQGRLIELAERDALTGLFNRRRFHEELVHRLAEANRRGEQLGLLCIDLDGFKAVNDTLGHQAGDAVLIRIAAEIAHSVRRNELFFRIGGDEFAILVSRATPEGTELLARRIVERAAESALTLEGDDLHVTLSVGIALSPDHSRDPEGLVQAADRAMYYAKSRGKNQWAMADLLEVEHAAAVEPEPYLFRSKRRND